MTEGELDKELLHVSQQLIYNQWSDAAAKMLAVRTEDNDGSPDWKLFHDERVTRAQEQLLYWTRMRDGINEQVKQSDG